MNTKSGIFIELPTYSQCVHCGHIEDLSYEINVRTAIRAKKVFTNKWLKEVYKEVRKTLEQDGWLFVGDSAYCPHCAALLEDGAIKPELIANDARSLINDLLLIHHARKTQRDLGAKDD